jgi:hypothetical protein
MLDSVRRIHPAPRRSVVSAAHHLGVPFTEHCSTTSATGTIHEHGGEVLEPTNARPKLPSVLQTRRQTSCRPAGPNEVPSSDARRDALSERLGEDVLLSPIVTRTEHPSSSSRCPSDGKPEEAPHRERRDGRTRAPRNRRCALPVEGRGTHTPAKACEPWRTQGVTFHGPIELPTTGSPWRRFRCLDDAFTFGASSEEPSIVTRRAPRRSAADALSKSGVAR